MVKYFFGLIFFALVMVSCAPKEEKRKFEPTKKFFELGPELSDVNWEGDSFANLNFEAPRESQVVSSSDLFEATKNIFLQQRDRIQRLEQKVFTLAYKMYSQALQLQELKALLDAIEDKSMRAKGIEVYENAKNRQAYTYQSYLVLLNQTLGEAKTKTLSFSSKNSDLFIHAKSLQSFRWTEPESGVKLKQKLTDLKSFFTKEENAGDDYLGFQETIDLLLSDLQSVALDKELLEKSLSLNHNFYNGKNTSSSVEPQNGPYLETALGLYGGDLYQIWVGRLQEIIESLDTAFSKVKIVIKEPTEENLEQPEEVVIQLNEQLTHFGSRLGEEGLSNLVVDQVDIKVAELQPLIRFAVANLKEMGPDLSLSRNLELFDQVLEKLEETKLFSESLMERIRSEVEFPKDIAIHLHLMEVDFAENFVMQSAFARTILVKLWRYSKAQLDSKIGSYDSVYKKWACSRFKKLRDRSEDHFQASASVPRECKEIPNLNGSKRTDFIVTELTQTFGNRSLVETLISCDEGDLQWLSRVDKDNLDGGTSRNYFWRPILSVVSSRIEDSLVETGVAGFSSGIQSAVSKALLRKVSIRLTQELRQFDAIIFRQIKASLAKMDLEWSSDFYHRIKDLAKAELKHRLLKNESKIHLLEAESVKLSRNNGSWVFENEKEKIFSGAMTITESLSSRILGLWGNNYLGDLGERNAKISFEIVNKAVAMVGTRNYYGELMPSLAVNVGRGTPKLLDIYTYAYEEDSFGIPEKFLVNSGVNIDLESIGEERAFSIESQASLLEAGSNTMQLMADWLSSPLDQSLHRLQYEGIDFFPKNSLVELGLGIASIVLRNLHKGGIALFDADRNELSYSKESSEDIASKVTSASVLALVSAKNSKQHREIDLKGLSKYMIALADFIEIADQANLSKSNTALVLSRETNEPQMKDLNKAVNLLKKLYIAMANFVSSRFINEDRLFFSTYNLDTKKASGHVLLQDQWLVQLALIKAYKMWDAEIYLWLAQDNYFAVNHKYLDLNTGLYFDFDTQRHISVIKDVAIANRSLESWSQLSESEFRGNQKLLKSLVKRQKDFLKQSL